jgi:hypothetical protein
MPKPLDDSIRRSLDAVQRFAKQLVSFSGDTATTTLVVEVAGMASEDAVRAAVGERPASSLTAMDRSAANPVRHTEQHVSGVAALSWRCAWRRPLAMKVL